MRYITPSSCLLVLLLACSFVQRAHGQAALEPLGRPLEHGGAVELATFSPDGRIVMTLDDYGVCWLWDVATQRIIGGSIQGPHERTLVNFDRKGKTVVGPGSPFAEVRAAGFTPDGKSLIVVSTHIQRWSPTKSMPQGRPIAMDGVVDEVYLSPTRKAVLAIGPTRTSALGRTVPQPPIARLLSTASGRQIGSVLKLGEADPRKEVGTAAFSPDGRTAYIVYPDRQVQRWDVSKGVRLKPDLEHPGDAEDMQFSADGKLVLTLGDGDARLWDAVTGSPVGKAFYAGRRDAAALSPDGAKAAGFNYEGQLFVAAVGRKKALFKLKTDRPRVGRINAIGFSPDSQRLVTVAKVAQVWNAATGKLLAEGGSHESPHRVAFSPAGDVFLVVDGGRVYLWKMPAQ